MCSLDLVDHDRRVLPPKETLCLIRPLSVQVNRAIDEMGPGTRQQRDQQRLDNNSKLRYE